MVLEIGILAARIEGAILDTTKTAAARLPETGCADLAVDGSDYNW
jgi:hypothetical protein